MLLEPNKHTAQDERFKELERMVGRQVIDLPRSTYYYKSRDKTGKTLTCVTTYSGWPCVAPAMVTGA